jgi:hypothetical protein
MAAVSVCVGLFQLVRGFGRGEGSMLAEFLQGLTLYYGFNHEAAIKSFRQVILLDPDCAMAWWGQAISAGPNINPRSCRRDAK